MSIFLERLEFGSSFPDGWSSKELVFGKKFTYIRGENTCGKTPLIRGMLYCLGINTSFRADIVEKCEFIRLWLRLNNKPFLFERDLREDHRDYIKVIDLEEDSEVKKYKVGSEISNFIFNMLQFPLTNLTHLSGSSVQMYFSVLTPLFWKEQLGGWHKTYNAESKFIIDQREEANRYLLGVGAKNPYEIKGAVESEKKTFRGLVEQIRNQNQFLKDMSGRLGLSVFPDVDELKAEKISIVSLLQSLGTEGQSLQGVTKSFNESITSLESERVALARRHGDLRRRTRNFSQIYDEVEAEIETLSLNDEAAEIFRDFNNICSQTGCGLFSASKEVYGKSLLYLKDQLKDLSATIESSKSESDSLLLALSQVENSIKNSKQERADTIKEKGHLDLATTISSYTKRLVEVDTKIAALDNLGAQQLLLNDLLNKRERSHERLETLKAYGPNREIEVNSAKRALEGKIDFWIEKLHLTGIRGQSKIDARFNFLLGDEKYDLLDGSARIRAVLAYNTALFELALETGGNHPGIFILDTPKQQEMKTGDLKEYFDELRRMIAKFPSAQVIFSSSEFDFVSTTEDEIWDPTFEGSDHLMYLGQKL